MAVVNSFHMLAIINTATVNIGVHVSSRIVVSQGICPVVGLLGHMVFNSQFFKESPYCFL